MVESHRRRTISVFIPAYNESENVTGAVLDVIAACRDFDDYEVLIVDDGSTDPTGAIIDQLAAEHEHVRALHHPHNRGFGAAYGTALGEARMEYFTFVPGDHEVAPESVSAIFAQVGKADIVVPFHGTPWKRPFFRRALTWISTTQVNFFFGWNYRYYQGPAVYPTTLARMLPRTVQGFYFATEMLVHALSAGYSAIEIGLTHQERSYGRSKAVAWSNMVNAQFTIVRLWLDIRILRRSNVPRAVRPEPASALEVA